jgi:nucleoside-diphosphate-sugar epimerase
MLVHRTPPAFAAGAAVTRVAGDLTDASSLEAACDGVRTVLHLAGYVGEDTAQCDAVNGRGTESLVVAARMAGVERIVYVSSAAVYGFGVHRGAAEDDVVVAPRTPVSRSRARAERAVLEAGGVVLRPLFVYGDGDTRFVPVVVGALRRLPLLVDHGRARLSLVAVDDLAAALVALAALPASGWRPGSYHVTDGQPVAFRQVVASLAEILAFPLPRFSVPYPLARLIVGVARGRSFGARRGSAAAHRLFLVARDHFYDSSRLWTLLGRGPGGPFVERIGEYADWYRKLLSGSASAVT